MPTADFSPAASEIVNDLYNLFRTLQAARKIRNSPPSLCARFNLSYRNWNQPHRPKFPLADQTKGGRGHLKMNALQDPTMINRLYEASEHGVQIDLLIVRGICCPSSGQSYSRNIRVPPALSKTVFWNTPASGTPSANEGRPSVYGSPDSGCAATSTAASKPSLPSSIPTCAPA